MFTSLNIHSLYNRKSRIFQDLREIKFGSVMVNDLTGVKRRPQHSMQSKHGC